MSLTAKQKTDIAKALSAVVLTAITGSGIYYYNDIQPVEPQFPAVIVMSKTDFSNLEEGLKMLNVSSERASGLIDYFKETKKTINPNEYIEWVRACNEIVQISKIQNWGPVIEAKDSQFTKKCNYLITKAYEIKK